MLIAALSDELFSTVERRQHAACSERFSSVIHCARRKPVAPVHRGRDR
jgi:hypothetical protein